jgi:nitrous oxidase accessory protein NosD
MEITKSIFKIELGFILGLIICSGAVSADILVVNQTSACTAGSSYHNNITSAIDTANNGDSIIVCSGTYSENVIISKPLSLTSHSNPATTTVKASDTSSSVFDITSDNVNISGFSIQD